MRCYCCNRLLTSQEATRRFQESLSFVDMCNECLNTISEEVDVTDGYTGDDDEEDSSLYRDE